MLRTIYENTDHVSDGGARWKWFMDTRKCTLTSVRVAAVPKCSFSATFATATHFFV